MQEGCDLQDAEKQQKNCDYRKYVNKLLLSIN